MEPIEALNRPIKESHKYILAMYANGSYLYILFTTHGESRRNRNGTFTADLRKGSFFYRRGGFLPTHIDPSVRESLFHSRLSSVYLYPRRIRFDGGQSSLFRFLFSRQRGNFDFDRPTSNGSENTFRPKHKAVVFRETHVRPPRTATQAGSGVRILFQKKPIGIYV